MNGMEKSDSVIVAMKPANKGTSVPAEPMEPRTEPKGNPEGQSTRRTQDRESVSQAADRIRQVVQREPGMRLTTLLHHVTVDALRWAFFKLKKDAAAGADGVTWRMYEEGLEGRLADLHDRVHSGAYRATPSRRVNIPKSDGSTRPLGVAATEDKIVQKAVAETILTPIYEAEFLGFSYGFRPGRGAHDALDALAVGISRRKIDWVVDCDIRKFFDSVSRDWLVRFLEHRIGDKRVIRLIAKWLNAGVMEDGEWQDDLRGTPQGSVISPILANVYLHYVLDLWFQKKWRGREVSGDSIIVRYADDLVAGFQHKRDAKRFLTAVKERFGNFGLELHPDKTRLVEFGRFASKRRRQRGQGRPETFDFLGFTHYCMETRRGRNLSTTLRQDDCALSSFSCCGCHGGSRRLGEAGSELWNSSNEALEMTGPGGLKGPPALLQHAPGSIVMHVVRGEHRDPAMAMFGVVPREERSAEGDRGGDVVEAAGKPGWYFRVLNWASEKPLSSNT